MRIVGVIPARYASSRFPGKSLALIAGKPLIQRVVEQCRQARALADVVVATDDHRIARVVEPFCRVEMTLPSHASGSDRIAEVAARLSCDALINVQGDEPLIPPAVIELIASTLKQHPVTTAASPIRTMADYDDPNVVKVVLNSQHQALYFSRRTIPYVRDAATGPAQAQLSSFPFLKHLGIYGYQRDALLRLVHLPVSSLEAAEKLEQLRALENGIPILVLQVDYESHGVDTPEDIPRIEAILRKA